MTHDDDILISPCDRKSRPAYPARLSVDDLDDPDETESTAEEIHVTVLAGKPEDLAFCFKLSVTSALELVRQLEDAIRRRTEGGDET